MNVPELTQAIRRKHAVCPRIQQIAGVDNSQQEPSPPMAMSVSMGPVCSSNGMLFITARPSLSRISLSSQVERMLVRYAGRPSTLGNENTDLSALRLNKSIGEAIRKAMTRGLSIISHLR